MNQSGKYVKLFSEASHVAYGADTNLTLYPILAITENRLTIQTTTGKSIVQIGNTPTGHQYTENGVVYRLYPFKEDNTEAIGAVEPMEEEIPVCE